MFAAIKRLIGATPPNDGVGDLLASWAKAEGHAFKRVKDKSSGGFVVLSEQGWRIEWGVSQRPYIQEKELRFLSDTGLPGDMQLIFLTKTLARTLESDVFSRYTHAMQTQVDHTLPDEMRWLAMHPRVSLSAAPLLAKRYALFTNAELLAQQCLSQGRMARALESAASTWWTDALLLVLTLNRGRLTMRTSGQALARAQIELLGALFAELAQCLHDVNAVMKKVKADM